ncbi:MAG: hypothetical protein AB2A00_40235 [Myxococcota bacterium]
MSTRFAFVAVMSLTLLGCPTTPTTGSTRAVISGQVRLDGRHPSVTHASGVVC